MARIRTIKPEFWENEDLSELSEPALLLAIGLLNHADDEGYFKANPLLIKKSVFPLREPSVSIHCMLTELSNVGYIRLLKGKDHREYGVIVNFTKHQNVTRPSKSKIKDIIHITEPSVNTHCMLTDGSLPEQGTGNREQGRESCLSRKLLRQGGEENFWRLASEAEDKIPKALCGKLAKAIGDWDEAVSALRQAMGKENPPAYVGAIIRDRMPGGGQKNKIPSGLPEKFHGASERVKKLPGGKWELDGEIYDKDANLVGW